MMDFNEIFRKYVTYDNIKSELKSGLHPPSRKHNFGKTLGEVILHPPLVFLGLRA